MTCTSITSENVNMKTNPRPCATSTSKRKSVKHISKYKKIKLTTSLKVSMFFEKPELRGLKYCKKNMTNYTKSN